MEGQAEPTRFEERYEVDATQAQACRCSSLFLLARRMLTRLRNQRSRSKDSDLPQIQRPTLDGTASAATMTLELSSLSGHEPPTESFPMENDESFSESVTLSGGRCPPRVTFQLDGEDVLTGSCAPEDLLPPPDATMALDDDSLRRLDSLDDSGDEVFGNFPYVSEDSPVNATPSEMQINFAEVLVSESPTRPGRMSPQQSRKSSGFTSETRHSRLMVPEPTSTRTRSRADESFSSQPMMANYSAAGNSEEWDGMDGGISWRSRQSEKSKRCSLPKPPAPDNVFDDDDLALDLLLLS